MPDDLDRQDRDAKRWSSHDLPPHPETSDAAEEEARRALQRQDELDLLRWGEDGGRNVDWQWRRTA